jgi:hypothetical protein
MRRIAFTLVGLVGLVLCGSQVAMAHGFAHGHRYPVARHAYYGNFGPRYVGGYGVGYAGYGVGYGGYGCNTGYAGYGVPYAAGYAQPGFGVSVPNFSLWYQQ